MHDEKNQLEKRPDCWKCHFLKITYIRGIPYGCSLMGFKSKNLPSFEVFKVDGEHCKGFSPK